MCAASSTPTCVDIISSTRDDIFVILANEHPYLLPTIKKLYRNERLRYKFYKIECESDIEIIKFTKYYENPKFKVLNAYYKSEDLISIPKFTTKLKFDRIFNQVIIAGSLPNSLEELYLGMYFNQPIKVGVLPTSLKKLSLGCYFNQPIIAGSLPNSLEKLDLGMYFNQPIEVGVLPKSLKVLEFSKRFNQLIEVGVLPNSLKNLNLNGILINL